MSAFCKLKDIELYGMAKIDNSLVSFFIPVRGSLVKKQTKNKKSLLLYCIKLTPVKTSGIGTFFASSTSIDIKATHTIHCKTILL